jgi:nitrous oxide reductase accessory protein NosL
VRGVTRTLQFLALGLGLAAAAPGAEPKVDTTCQLCGMDAAKSETEFVLYLKSEPEMHACCFNCARRIMAKMGDAVTRVTTLDYHTRKQVAAREAFYVYGAPRQPKGSMSPSIFGFAARQDADNFKSRNGGAVLTFDEALAKLKVEPE